MEQIEKEVDFAHYCNTCKSKAVSENIFPCHECLSEPVREYTRKPLNWKPAGGYEGYLAPEHEGASEG